MRKVGREAEGSPACGGAQAELMLAECRSLLGLAGALEKKIFYSELCNAAACPDLNSLQFSGL